MLRLWLDLFLVFLFTAPSAFAFNKDRCGTIFPKSDDDHPPYYAPLYISTMVPSTTSYFSSVGPCSMYGSTGISVRQSFIQQSKGLLQADIVRGRGEYLAALAELSGCSTNVYPEFASALRSQADSLFSEGAAEAPLASKIDSILQGSPVLRQNCQVSQN